MTALPLLVTALALAAAALAGCGSAARTSSAASAARTTSATRTTSAPVPPEAGIPAALVRESRPIGRGQRFHPPATGPMPGACRRGLGPREGVHIEIFAANRVVLVAAGIGTRPPVLLSEGRIAHARCYGDLVTLEPTGVVLVRPGARLRLAAVFRAWGEPLSRRRIASFGAPPGGQVSTYVDGRRWTAAPGMVPLSRHAEIVVEVGPHVPPHSAYAFPPGS